MYRHSNGEMEENTVQKVYCDMLYVVACGIHNRKPESEILKGMEPEKLFAISRAHYLDALVGTTLKKAGMTLEKEWEQKISKAVRRVLMFDSERGKILDFMEQNGIWYLPLKGILLKDYYPAVGMRQMSDNDILFDASYSGVIQNYMKQQGYKAVYVNIGTHDVYQKAPVYNFEMHRILYEEDQNEEWSNYYKNIKEKLILNPGTSYGYHFKEEDFYVYIMTHAYKHYAGSGTGLRTLVDFYVYLKKQAENLDFSYIENECAVLGIEEFEKLNRKLSQKVFAKTEYSDMEKLEEILSEEEKNLLLFYLSSGVYGTVEQEVKNKIEKFKEKSSNISKARYLWKRLFPDKEDMEKYFPFFSRYKILFPAGYVYRLFRALFSTKRRKRIQKEVQVVKKERM